MQLTVVSANISADFLTPPGVPAWDDRKWPLVAALRNLAPQIISLQEVTPNQFAYLQAQLPEHTALTVEPHDPDPEMLAGWGAKYARFGFPTPPSPYEIVLFYHTDTWSLETSGHWWLSPTPERPSVGFGNVAPRVVLWATLTHCHSRHGVSVFTTHLDHRCIQPMVDLCRAQFAAQPDPMLSQIFMGDMNFNPFDLQYAQLMQDGWQDSHSVTQNDNASTFLYTGTGAPSGRIDHIFYRGPHLSAQNWSRLQGQDITQRFSDHDPICVQFQIGQ